MICLGRNAVLDELILDTLNKQSFMVDNLQNTLKSSQEWETLLYPEKTFKETLGRLLYDGKIQIEGYFPKYRKNSLSSDRIRLGIVEKDPTEISHKIRKIFDQDFNDTFKAKNDIKKIFIKKILNNKQLKIKKWNRFSKDIVISDSVHDKVILLLESQKSVKKDIEIGNQILSKEEYNNAIQKTMGRYKDKIPELRQKYQFLKTRCLENESIEKLVISVKPDKFKRYYLYFDDETIIDKNDINFRPVSHDKFLEMKLKFPKPIERDYSEFEDLYEEVISYINSMDSGQNYLINMLAFGLSDKRLANKSLEKVIFKCTGKKEFMIY